MTKVSRKGSFTQDMFSFECAALRIICGDNSKEVTPVPIPNTEVKLLSADDTWRETAWESRTLPLLLKKNKSKGLFFFACRSYYVNMFKKRVYSVIRVYIFRFGQAAALYQR